MTSPHCPGQRELAAFDAGELTELDAEQIAAHIEECGACRSAMQRLEAGNVLAAALRLEAPYDEYRQEAACRAALARVAAIGHESTSTSAHDGDGPTIQDDELKTLRDYQLLEKLGQGGMGTVYRARHNRLKRVVALKVLPRAHTQDPRAVARFEREMEAVGQLDHPHIVRAMDAGEVDGVHFLVMECVPGSDLSALLDRHGPLAIADACELARQAAVGLHYAHQNGLVHRDVKPSNLMLAAGGQVKILDLGLALLQEGFGAGGRELTNSGQFMGTLDYMAPEQGDDSHAVDARADIYSLGATLYKLLCGDAPFGGGKYPTPLLKIAALATATPMPMQERRLDVPAALSQVVDRMLAKEPAERFATAGEVAAALAPFCAGADLAALLATPAPQPAAPKDGDTTPVAKLTTDVSTGARERLTEIPPALDSPASKAALPPRRNFRVWIGVATALAFLGALAAWQIVIRITDKDGKEQVIPVAAGSKLVIEQVPDATPAPPMPEPRGKTLQPVAATPTPPAAPNAFDLLRREDIPDYELFVAGGGDPANAPKELVAIIGDSRLRHWNKVHSLAFSPDSKLLASGASDTALQLWEMGDGKEVRTLSFGDHRVGTASYVGFTPDCQRLVSCVASSGTVVSDVATGNDVQFFPSVYAADVSRDGVFFLSAAGAALGVNRLTDGQVRWGTGSLEYLENGAFSPDGLVVATTSRDAERNLKLLDAATGKELRTLLGHTDFVYSVAFSPDGQHVASASQDGTLRIWDTASGEQQKSFEFQAGPLTDLAYTPDGSMLAAGFDNGSVRLLNAETGEQARSLKGYTTGSVATVAVSPNGAMLAAGGRENTIKVWNIATGDEMFVRSTHEAFVSGMAVSSDGAALATCSYDGTAKVWDLPSCRQRFQVQADEGQINAVQFNPEGRSLATAHSEPEYAVRFWDAVEGKPLGVIPNFPNRVLNVAYSPDGRHMAATTLFGASHHLWETPFDFKTDIATSSLLGSSPGNGTGDILCFSRDSKTLVTVTAYGHEVKLWDVATRQVRQTLNASMPQVVCLALSPDGKMLAVGGVLLGQSVIEIWDLTTGDSMRTLRFPTAGAQSLAFSPDGATLVSSSGDGKIRLWDPEAKPGVSPLRQTITLGPSAGLIPQVLYSPEGRHLITLNGNGTVYVLRLSEP